MTTATMAHLTGYPSEQNRNVTVNQLLNGALSPALNPSRFAVHCRNQVMSVFDLANVSHSSTSVRWQAWGGCGGNEATSCLASGELTHCNMRAALRWLELIPKMVKHGHLAER